MACLGPLARWLLHCQALDLRLFQAIREMFPLDDLERLRARPKHRLCLQSRQELRSNPYAYYLTQQPI